MSKYYISEFEIDSFINPTFDTEEEAQKWLDNYIDDLAARDEGLGINWDACSWKIEQHEQE
jgi:hypothetical protein